MGFKTKWIKIVAESTKGGEATTNTKIVAIMPAAAAATSTSTATVFISKIIDQTLVIFFPVGESRPYLYILLYENYFNSIYSFVLVINMSFLL